MVQKQRFRSKQNNGTQPRRSVWYAKCPDIDAFPREPGNLPAVAREPALGLSKAHRANAAPGATSADLCFGKPFRQAVSASRLGKLCGPGDRRNLNALLCSRFLLNHNLQVSRHVLVQLHRHAELADGLQRLVQLDLAPIDVEALLGQRIADVARRH